MNNVDVVGFDSCEEAARLWECKVFCNLSKYLHLFWEAEVCGMACFLVDMGDLSDKCAESGGYNVFQGMESTEIAPVFLCRDWTIGNEVVRLGVVNALL